MTGRDGSVRTDEDRHGGGDAAAPGTVGNMAEKPFWVGIRTAIGAFAEEVNQTCKISLSCSQLVNFAPIGF